MIPLQQNLAGVTFICRCAGVCAFGVVIAKHVGDERLVNYYLRQFKEIELPHDFPYEVLYGITGYLWACSFSNKNISKHTIQTPHMRPIVEEVITAGRQLSQKGGVPFDV